MLHLSWAPHSGSLQSGSSLVKTSYIILIYIQRNEYTSLARYFLMLGIACIPKSMSMTSTYKYRPAFSKKHGFFIFDFSLLNLHDLHFGMVEWFLKQKNKTVILLTTYLIAN